MSKKRGERFVAVGLAIGLGSFVAVDLWPRATMALGLLWLAVLAAIATGLLVGLIGFGSRAVARLIDR